MLAGQIIPDDYRMGLGHPINRQEMYIQNQEHL